MENSFGLNTIPNIGKFALAKNFMGSPDRIKEMKNQEFEHDLAEKPIKHLANGFTLKMTAVISPKEPNCNHSQMATSTLRKKKFQRIANSIRFMNQMKAFSQPRAQSSNNVANLRQGSFFSRDQSPLSQANRNTVTRHDNSQTPNLSKENPPRSQTNQRLRVKKIKTSDLFNNFQKSKEIAIQSQSSNRPRDDINERQSMRAGTALSGLNTRLKLKNRIEMNNVDLIKDEINYDTNQRPLSIERPSNQKDEIRHTTPINKTSRPPHNFPNDAEIQNETQLPSITPRQTIVKNTQTVNLSSYITARRMTSLNLARHHKNLNNLSPFMAFSPKHFDTQNKLFYNLQSKQISSGAIQNEGSDLKNIQVVRYENKQTFVRPDNKTVVPFITGRKKINFESSRMMNLRMRMALPDSHFQKTQIFLKDSQERVESPSYSHQLLKQDLSTQMNKIEPSQKQ